MNNSHMFTAHVFSNLGEINQFFENLKLIKLTHIQVHNLNNATTVKEIGSLLNTSENKVP